MKKSRKVLVVIVILIIYLSLGSWSNITSAAMETAERILIDFKNAGERENWQIINDDVMGGVSRKARSSSMIPVQPLFREGSLWKITVGLRRREASLVRID